MQRHRLTITLDTEILAALDTFTDGDLLRNRSQTLEHVLKEGLGLYNLRQAFIFAELGWQQIQLEATLNLASQSRISTLYLCLPSAQAATSQEMRAIIVDYTIKNNLPAFEVIPVPSDFGSGTAVLLQKDHLETTFLIFELGTHFQAPTSLATPLAFHRQHHTAATLMLASNNSIDYSYSGIAIAEPELTTAITGGTSSLQQHIFPQLLKDGRVRGYLLPATR